MDCKFLYYHHKVSKSAVVNVSYELTSKNCLVCDGEYQRNCPAILININNCEFSKNSISSLSLYYQKLTYKHVNLVKIEDTYFLFNHRAKGTVVIEGPKKSDTLCMNRIPGSRGEISIVNFLNCTFRGSSSTALHVQNSSVALRGCIFYNSTNTFLDATKSMVTVSGQNTFKHSCCAAKHGGGLSLNDSILLLMPNSHTLITHNTATYGGGLYSESSPIQLNLKNADIGIYSNCTIVKYRETETAQVEFVSNQAKYTGDSIFRGNYINCTYNCTEKGQCRAISYQDTVSFDSQQIPSYIIITPYSNLTKFSEVSSPANRICICENDIPTGECCELNITAFPGQEFNLSLIALGKLNGSTPVIVSARSVFIMINIDNGLQVLQRNCTTVNYSVPSTWSTVVKLKISEETPEQAISKTVQPKPFRIKFYSSPCPDGFKLSRHSFRCECSDFFTKFSIKCNAKKGVIHIKEKQWIGYYKQNNALAVADGYPLDYLFSGDKHLNLSTPDVQCNFNRGGVLCGSCQGNFCSGAWNFKLQGMLEYVPTSNHTLCSSWSSSGGLVVKV